jgi:hypothetical protein
MLLPGEEEKETCVEGLLKGDFQVVPGAQDWLPPFPCAGIDVNPKRRAMPEKDAAPLHFRAASAAAWQGDGGAALRP